MSSKTSMRAEQPTKLCKSGRKMRVKIVSRKTGLNTPGNSTGRPNIKGRPGGSVALFAEYSYGKREALGLSPGRATTFSSPVTFAG